MTAAVLPARDQSALPAAFQPSEVNYVAVMPLLIVFVTALVGVLVEAFAPRERRHVIQVTLAVVGLAAAAVSIIWASNNLGLTMGLTDGATNRSLFALAIDGPALFLQGAIVLMGILGVLTMAERFGGVGPDAFTPSGASTPGSAVETAATRAGALTSEVFPLTVFAIFGMMLFPTTNDLIGMFVALEVLSLPLYILTGLARRRRLLSQEASLKYFLLGAFSSAFFLFGTALLYGYAGSVYFGELSKAITTAPLAMNGLLLPGAFLVFVGLLFKVGAVPFHAWTPDVYQGAPTPVTGFMAACTKAAAFGAILRLAYVGLDTGRWEWTQRPRHRRAADHGRRLGALRDADRHEASARLLLDRPRGLHPRRRARLRPHGVGAVLFYVVAYGFSTIAAFAIIALVRQNGAEATHLSQWAGLGKRHPLVVVGLRVPHARLRRHPADVGLRVEVRRVLGGRRLGRDRHGARRRRCAVQRHHGLRLRPRHRAHVLQRAAGGEPSRSSRPRPRRRSRSPSAP